MSGKSTVQDTAAQQRKTAQADAVWQQTVDWAGAKLPRSQQEHLARQPATLVLPTAYHQPLEGAWMGDDGGVARIFCGKNILSRANGEDHRSEIQKNMVATKSPTSFPPNPFRIDLDFWSSSDMGANAREVAIRAGADHAALNARCQGIKTDRIPWLYSVSTTDAVFVLFTPNIGDFEEFWLR